MASALFDLSGRVAVVTGGNGGIGLGMAEGLAGAGASILVVGRSAAKNEAAEARLRALGAPTSSLVADAADPAECRRYVAAAEERFGRLDILIANAGVNIRKPPEAYSPEEWNAVLTANLSSAFYGAQAAHPAFLRQQGGKVVVIGSMTSIFGASFAAPYSASKGGIVQLARALATAWAARNIQVNAVLPGWIDTDLTRQARQDLPGLNERVLARTPAGRWGAPQDLAGIAVFLASRASDFVTGTAIPVDGGYSVQA